MALAGYQRVWLAVLPKVSSVFSLFGSMWIIIEVATERRKRRVPYHRLLLAMSVYDVLESVWNFGSTWPIPEGSPDVIWAIGNEATCTAQGFFLTLSSAVPLYNAMLSLYYYLVINHNYSDSRLRSCVEPAMHLFCFVWAFGTATYSAAAGLINNANLWCWIAPLPAGCLNSWIHGTAEEGNPNPCIRGDNIWVYRFGFYFIPLWLSIFFATGCTYAVYRFVHKRDRATLRYRFPHSHGIFGALKSFGEDMKSKMSAFSLCRRGRRRTGSPSNNGATNGEEPHKGMDSTGDLDDLDSSHDSKANHHPNGASDSNDDSHGEMDGAKMKSNQDPNNILDPDSAGQTASEGFSSEESDENRIVDLGLGLPLETLEERSENDQSSRGYRFDGSSRSMSLMQEKSEGFKIMPSKPVEVNTPYKLQDSLQASMGLREPTGAWALSWEASLERTSSVDDSVEVAAAAIAEEEQQQQEQQEQGQQRLPHQQQEQKQKQQQEHQGQTQPSRKNRRSTLRQVVVQWKKKREQFAEEMPHTVEVYRQALFFLGVFYCTHIWSTTNRIVQTITGGGSVFPLLALHAFFDPFQGFLNFLVYQRPRFWQLRKRHPEFGFCTIMGFILRFSFMGGTDASNVRSSSRNRSQSQRSQPSCDNDLGVPSCSTSAPGNTAAFGSSHISALGLSSKQTDTPSTGLTIS